MERRYEAYKSIVVKPFFREHFARIDRQIVLVDVLQALNAGSAAVTDLEKALSDILGCFNHGKRSWLTSLFTTRTDRILFAATKADHLHHANHDRLEAILARLVERATKRAQFSGAETDVVAMAAIRATKEAAMTGLDMPLPQAFYNRYHYEQRRVRSNDAQEGPLAFAEKRAPRWTGA